jgi:hypothetical protein
LANPAFQSVIVADRGFARASLFVELNQAKRAFAIRFDAQTFIELPEPLSPDLPRVGLPREVLGLKPGQRVWCPQATYGKEDRVPIHLLAVWDHDQKEPWFIASTLDTLEQTETVYRWRMRLELANRDEKTGVILREGGDAHRLTNLLHVHRLLLALLSTEWLCALTGLQAWHDLPGPDQLPPSPEEPASDATPPQSLIPRTLGRRQAYPPDPKWATDQEVFPSRPAKPPPIIPHRGPPPGSERSSDRKPPAWLRCFTARGWLSYVRLGKEVIGLANYRHVFQQMVRWLANYLWRLTPLWRHHQMRYRLRNWWSWLDSS